MAAGPMQRPCAIGTTPDGSWVGFVQLDDAFRLAVGDAAAPRDASIIEGREDAALLLSLASAYFADLLEDPPPDIEATQADVSALVRHVAAGPVTPRQRELLAEVVDAIDDGLAVDAVLSRLAAAASSMTDEPADPVDLLLAEVERLRRAG